MSTQEEGAAPPPAEPDRTTLVILVTTEAVNATHIGDVISFDALTRLYEWAAAQVGEQVRSAGIDSAAFWRIYHKSQDAALALREAARDAAGRDAEGGAPGVCRVCGCTDEAGCYDAKTGETCHWVEPDLCSRCAEKDPPQIPPIGGGNDADH